MTPILLLCHRRDAHPETHCVHGHWDYCGIIFVCILRVMLSVHRHTSTPLTTKNACSGSLPWLILDPQVCKNHWHAVHTSAEAPTEEALITGPCRLWEH